MVAWRVGDLRIDRVEEMEKPLVKLRDLLPDLPEDAMERHAHWLFPGFEYPATGLSIMAEHSWVVRTRHHVVLIDTCWGNAKPRPGVGDRLDTPWLERLTRLGLRPEDIDIVMCTHLHADHVGWNTRLVDGRWVPTFPNARYLFGRREYDHWRNQPGAAFGNDAAFQDSILPCVEAGLAELVDGATVSTTSW
jgi:glyoxylase-like metal-dependent hydrolase (beta-lactamase superfamily II)